MIPIAHISAPIVASTPNTPPRAIAMNAGMIPIASSPG
jgi:hypothetical protein